MCIALIVTELVLLLYVEMELNNNSVTNVFLKASLRVNMYFFITDI